LEANGNDEDQIDEEANLKGCILGETNHTTFNSSKVDKQVVEELERESGGGSY